MICICIGIKVEIGVTMKAAKTHDVERGCAADVVGWILIFILTH